MGSEESKIEIIPSSDLDPHFFPLVIHFPEEGKVLVEEAPEKAEDLARDKDYGFKVLIQVFKELQELGDERVQAILDKHQVRYEEPGW